MTRPPFKPIREKEKADAKWMAEALRQAQAGAITFDHMLKIDVRLRPFTPDKNGDILKLNHPDGSVTAWKVLAVDEVTRTSTVTPITPPL